MAFKKNSNLFLTTSVAALLVAVAKAADWPNPDNIHELSGGSTP